MRLIRQILGCSRKDAEADEMRRAHVAESRKDMRHQRAQVIVLERLVKKLQKDTAK